MDKPWGNFERYVHDAACTVKIITIASGEALSRQYHHKRDELWIALDPGACVEIGEKVLYPVPMQRLFIPREKVHRLSATGPRPVRILEISFGEFDEEDIVRLEDVYGRG